MATWVQIGDEIFVDTMIVRTKEMTDFIKRYDVVFFFSLMS